MSGVCPLPECTGQVESIGGWVLLQMVHDISIFIPGRYHAKVIGDRRYPIEGENIVVLDLLHQYHFLVKSLFYLSEQRRATLTRGFARHAYDFDCSQIRAASRRPENRERHHLIVVPTLPNFSHPRDALWVVPLLHDAVELVRCWDYEIVTT